MARVRDNPILRIGAIAGAVIAIVGAISVTGSLLFNSKDEFIEYKECHNAELVEYKTKHSDRHNTNDKIMVELIINQKNIIEGQKTMTRTLKRIERKTP